ncbi:MAG: Holliday junction resolvase RuvX [Candidatus Moranbacteria bacterium]|jgi:putative Holliday junction resolvase|nr:Holliday junction resolvase RuvX [Candidatus Moranbacteria bacterium]
MNKNDKKYLGIDWGSAKIGLAVADEETKISFGYGKIENDRNLLENLIKIITKEEIDAVVIGIPEHIVRQGEDFEGKLLGDEIEKKTKIQVYYQNEMFTTKMAEANLIERGTKKIKNFDDEESARIILQEWMDCKSIESRA